MMTDPASAIKREVLQLIELQIETLRREGRLTDSDLEQYRARSGKISRLYQELDRIGRTRYCHSLGLRKLPWFEGVRPPPPARMLPPGRRPVLSSV